MSLKHRIEREGIELSSETIERLEAFAKHLMKWNRIHNLTGARTLEAIEEQIFDSLYPILFLPSPETLLDIGTGAGFPGMVLAIVMPDTACTLCEPLAKRASFLGFIARELGLENVTVEARRIEDLPPFFCDLITSRAVTETSTLIAWCRPFIGEKTQLLFYKGEHVFGEVTELARCDYELITRDKRNYLWIKDAYKC
ncbi:16S rRNA (guanine(527)-N(7))-methyltransferase RsmG [Hydrogenimonas urashimensis]|uniref:16S rRNA (guanine(527)-N(7))-methyltransferase RsmG n=1 Tax=Hydrogenimonas urashimensis TaxID=2740515 RepID=UPI0019165DF7|nr:16S rRNA (guanine(527)-N(7))-methyltransferase RsmG [Hydrogenimonas urashimensis]